MATDPFWIVTDLPGRLAIMPRPRAGDWLEEEVASLKAANLDVVVSLLENDEIAELELGDEGHLCRTVGIDFSASRSPTGACLMRLFYVHSRAIC